MGVIRTGVSGSWARILARNAKLLAKRALTLTISIGDLLRHVSCPNVGMDSAE